MSTEKDNWQRLQLAGVVPLEEPFSPGKAKEGYYTELLRDWLKKPLEVDANGQPVPDAIKTVGDSLADLEDKASSLLTQRVSQSHRLIHLREAASDLGLNVRDGELKRVLFDARRKLDGVTESVGQRALSIAPVPWMVDGLLMARCLNLLIAPPKVGKTSMALQMISQWAAGADSYLGQRFCTPCPPVLVVGPDMPECDWAHLLNGMGLLHADLRLKRPLVDLFTAGSRLQLDEEGIERIAAYAAQHQDLLVVVDSIATVTGRLGISENDPEIAQPLLALIEALEPHGATLLVIHHANKARMGENPTMASRGSSAIPALASHMVGLSRLNGQAQLNGKTDRRVVLKTEGRGGMPLELLIERVEEAGWICHGDAESVQSERQRQEVEEKLSDRQQEAMELVRDRWELDGLPMDAMDLAPLLGLGSNGERKARSTLDQLARRGLLTVEVQNTGVSRRKVFRPVGTPRGGVCLRASEPSEPSEPLSKKEGLNLQKPDGERDRRDRRDKRDGDTRGVVRRASLRTGFHASAGMEVGSGADAFNDDDDPAWGPRRAL